MKPEDTISFENLFEKYQALLTENRDLKKELSLLKARLEGMCPRFQAEETLQDSVTPETILSRSESDAMSAEISNLSDSKEKIRLFMSLFKGREDVYAKRWENKKGKSGYSPFCRNEWKPGVCIKQKGACAACGHKDYGPLDETVIDDHLRGKITAGIYPMGLDDACWFLAMDFDGEEWRNDISALRNTCMEFDIPVAVERSRSGNGAHAWFFFERQIQAALARKLGASMITYSMNRRHEIAFKSYDRFFPNQDTLPKGGLGNLIALPLQKGARKQGNSAFIDDDFAPYHDQWAFLAAIRRFSEDDVAGLVHKLSGGNELGVLRIEEEEAQRPWETAKDKLTAVDFPRTIEILKANMLYIPKAGFSQRALNRLKRLAAFKNPEFFKAQAMRLPTHKKPPIIACADETTDYLGLPRGCETDLDVLLSEHGTEITRIDHTICGKPIDVEFNGNLRDEQISAIERLLSENIGVLCGTTAFGKTVVAIKLIAERKVNTLILVNRVGLVSQWTKRLMEFLTIHETLPVLTIEEKKRRGRKKARSVIGQLGEGKNTLSGIIDIALMQSLVRIGEVKDVVKEYGMIIVDECHHVAAFSFETILKNTNAKYICGLTATPTRKDGHHPIIFMQCGPIRFRDDARKQAEKRPFKHYVIPRFTPFRIPLDKNEGDVSIQELYREIAVNEMRNQLIINDIIKCHENGRNCLVLTERTAHVSLLAENLKKEIEGVITLTGGKGAKETGEIFRQISETPIDRQLTLIATGRYIGEGFDEPRLDTLFLTMPISWKGTLQQYAGRLHRLFENKKEVHVYDYVDVHVRMLEKMYHKRQSGYSSIGYKVKGEPTEPETIDIIFDKSNFLPVYTNDIFTAKKEILIVSPFVTGNRTVQMMQHLEISLRNGVKVTVMTRPAGDFALRDPSVLQRTLDLLHNAGVHMICRSNIHQKFAVIDQKIVWYGSINLLSFGGAEESIMRLESLNIAHELLKSLERKDHETFDLPGLCI